MLRSLWQEVRGRTTCIVLLLLALVNYLPLTGEQVFLSAGSKRTKSIVVATRRETNRIKTPSLPTSNIHHPQESNNHTNAAIRYKWRPTAEWIESCVTQVENDENLMKPLGSSKRSYVVGDCIKMCFRCTLGPYWATLPFKRHLRLTDMYAALACPIQTNPNYEPGGNMEVLRYVLKVYEEQHSKQIQKPDTNAVVLHFRLGDALEGSKQNISTLLLQGGNPAHEDVFANSIKSIAEYLDNLEEANNNNSDQPISTIEIRGGGFLSHTLLDGKTKFATGHTKSRIYATCMERAFTEAGYHVHAEYDHSDADLDFVFMANAQRFIASTGGYSALIGRYVKFRGGEVLGRFFDDMSVIPTKEDDAQRNRTKKEVFLTYYQDYFLRRSAEANKIYFEPSNP